MSIPRALGLILLVAGCGARVEGKVEDDPSARRSTKATATLTADGTIAVSSSDGPFEVSLAILPRTFTKGGLYEYEGAGYPSTQAAREAVFDGVAYTYAQLVAECAALHPGLDGKDVMAVEKCAYSDFGIKPYWIPSLVVDVDGCGRKLGPGWRLPTEQDVKRLSAAERAAIAETTSMGLYNGGTVFVRLDGGSVGLANLFDGTLLPFTDSSGFGFDPRRHYEGGASLRCVRGL